MAGPGDRVDEREADACKDAFRAVDRPCRVSATVEEAMRRVLAEVRPGDTVLLSGAHAMDRAADLWRRLAQSGGVPPNRELAVVRP